MTTSTPATDPAIPTFGSVVLDCPEPERLARFYAELLGWPGPSGEDGWFTVNNPAGGPKIEFQLVEQYRAPDWPSATNPQQCHLDLRVTDLDAAHERALGLGARLLDQQRSFWVYADPAGHPFCLCAC